MIGRTNAVIQIGSPSSRVDVVTGYQGAGASIMMNSNITSWTTTYSGSSATPFSRAMFADCRSLEYVDMGESMSSIGELIFNSNNINFTSLIIRRSSCSLGGTNIISAVPNNINVYVPDNSIESYKVATNWSTLFNNGKVVFLPLSEWQV